MAEIKKIMTPSGPMFEVTLYENRQAHSGSERAPQADAAGGRCMIYLDQHTEPNEIARTLWRELGPEKCLAIAITIATRSTEFTTFVIDVSGLTEDE